uniref:Uncharacterized protein n=1 Tax=Anguilla anguilla TaxID=7936 RepID=A0A0E9RA45_ANGAN
MKTSEAILFPVHDSLNSLCDIVNLSSPRPKGSVFAHTLKYVFNGFHWRLEEKRRLYVVCSDPVC